MKAFLLFLSILSIVSEAEAKTYLCRDKTSHIIAALYVEKGKVTMAHCLLKRDPTYVPKKYKDYVRLVPRAGETNKYRCDAFADALYSTGTMVSVRLPRSVLAEADQTRQLFVDVDAGDYHGRIDIGYFTCTP